MIKWKSPSKFSPSWGMAVLSNSGEPAVGAAELSWARLQWVSRPSAVLPVSSHTTVNVLRFDTQYGHQPLQRGIKVRYNSLSCPWTNQGMYTLRSKKWRDDIPRFSFRVGKVGISLPTSIYSLLPTTPYFRGGSNKKIRWFCQGGAQKKTWYCWNFHH